VAPTTPRDAPAKNRLREFVNVTFSRRFAGAVSL
jgi:hypothetical protein